MLIPTTAFLLGVVHALGPDHLAAVSTFLSHRRGPARTLGVSVEWGVGHMIGVLAPAVIFSTVLGSIPHPFTSYAELVVGLVLVWVGLLALRWSYISRRAHSHGARPATYVHAHLHTADHGREGYGRRLVGLTGVVHGLAGSLPALASVATAGSVLELISSLSMFGLGVVLAMAAYCLLLGALLQPVRETHLVRFVQPALGGFSCVLGLVWMFRTGLIL